MESDRNFRKLDDKEQNSGAKVSAGLIAVGTILCFTPAASFGIYLISGGIGIGVGAATGVAPTKPHRRGPPF